MKNNNEQASIAGRLEVVRETALPFKAGCYEVEEVFPGSPADEAGIQPGFWMKVNGKMPEDVLNLPGRMQHGMKQTWQFYDPEKGRLLQLQSTGFPFGMGFRLPLHLLADTIRERSEEAIYEAIERILENPDRAEFEMLGMAARHVSKGGSLTQKTGFLVSNVAISALFPPYLLLWGGYRVYKFTRYRRNPDVKPYGMERLIWAAWEIAHGDPAVAQKVLPSGSHVEIESNTSNVHALHAWVEGNLLLNQAQGAEEEEAEILRDEAWEYLQYARLTSKGSPLITDTLFSLTSEKPEPEPEPAPEAFEEDYDLPVFDPLEQNEAELADAPYVRFKETLGKLEDNQFLLVIMLGSYRANGPYAEGIRLLQQLYPLLSPHIGAIHVVTSWDESTADPAMARHWVRQETRAKASGVPITVLYDDDYVMNDILPTNHSPHIAIFSNRFIKLYEGTVGEKGYWRALEALKNREGLASSSAAEAGSDEGGSSLVPKVPQGG